jgi:glycosyltransferase involved in cell wall biosynthesis
LQDLFPEAAAALGVKGAQGLMGRVLRRLRDQTLRAAAMNVVLGKRMAAAILQRGIVASRIMAIPNWADGDLIRPGVAEKNPLRTEWGLADKLVVGYSGNLGRAHEFRTILAAAELLRNDPKFVFLFVGEGYWASWVREVAARIGLKNVILKGYQPRELLSVSLAVPDVHVISLLPEVEGYIVPSKFYGVAAAGRPVIFIGSPEGELAEQVADIQCGVTIQPGHAQELVTFLRALRDDPGMRSDMGRRIRAAFDGKYERQHAIRAWRTLLGRLGSAGR